VPLSTGAVCACAIAVMPSAHPAAKIKGKIRFMYLLQVFKLYGLKYKKALVGLIDNNF
jgi:hypothetical protein